MSSTFPRYGCVWEGGEKFLLQKWWKRWKENRGLDLNWEELKKFSLVCVLIGSILKKNEQKDYFHSYNTDVVVAYKNVVIYIVDNAYIMVVYIGNISPAGS